MEKTNSRTYNISLVSILSFFGIIFALMPFKMRFFGILPGIFFFIFFALSMLCWFLRKAEPKHRIIFAIFFVAAIFKIVGLVVGNDYHIR